MKNYPKRIKGTLHSVIRDMAKHPEDFCRCPEKDFTRNRKLPFEKILTLLVKMGAILCVMKCWIALAVRKHRHLYLPLFSNGANYCRKLWNICFGNLRTGVTSQSYTKDIGCWLWMAQICNLLQILMIHYPISQAQMVKSITVFFILMLYMTLIPIYIWMLSCRKRELQTKMQLL